MNNKIPSDNKIMTLQDVTLRKALVLKEIQSQKGAITEAARNVFTPYSATINSGNQFIKKINTGMALFDGVILGIKMMRKVRQMFRK